MEEKHPVFTDRALSSEAHILWGLSNFFLQLFIWGLPTGLFLFWTATLWEGFFVLAFLTGVAGIIVAVVPLWVILYPSRNLPKQPKWRGDMFEPSDAYESVKPKWVRPPPPPDELVKPKWVRPPPPD